MTGVIGATRRTRSASSTSSRSGVGARQYSAKRRTKSAAAASLALRPRSSGQLPEQALDRGAGVVEDGAIAAEPEARVGAHDHRVELEGEAAGLGEPAILAWRSSSPSQASSAAAIASRTGPGRSSYSAEVAAQKQPPE